MVSLNSPRQLTQREEKIIAIIRESLLEDPRIRRLATASVSLDGRDELVQAELDHRDEIDVANALTPCTKQEVSESKIEIIGSPGIAPTETPIDQGPQNGSPQANDILSGRSSVAGRLVRTSVYGAIVVGIVSAGLALPRYENQLKNAVFGARNYLASDQLEPRLKGVAFSARQSSSQLVLSVIQLVHRR